MIDLGTHKYSVKGYHRTRENSLDQREVQVAISCPTNARRVGKLGGNDLEVICLPRIDPTPDFRLHRQQRMPSAPICN